MQRQAVTPTKARVLQWSLPCLFSEFSEHRVFIPLILWHKIGMKNRLRQRGVGNRGCSRACLNGRGGARDDLTVVNREGDLSMTHEVAGEGPDGDILEAELAFPRAGEGEPDVRRKNNTLNEVGVAGKLAAVRGRLVSAIPALKSQPRDMANLAVVLANVASCSSWEPCQCYSPLSTWAIDEAI
ncbi:hypothetical protein F0562_012007 [Nyssa sinensis]|uniref:Uncharacterized protein n=1 Tax=Nyssa sinensis TaxID=561372 RepID=A0A5J4ZTZ9_9ASTE|nr:hypothetical protein F0562_012007 [Nyssa sinensis]